MAEYGISRRTTLSFEDAVAKTQKALSANGFGVMTTIDVQGKMKEKLGKDMGKYLILGACSPVHAFMALQAEPEIGLLLPCNVIVYEDGDEVVVSAIDPIVMFSIIDRPDVAPVAEEVKNLLTKVIDTI